MCDVCLLDSLLVKQKPSLIAALCIYTAQRVVKGEEGNVWNATMIKNTGYRIKDFKSMSDELIIYVKNISKSALQTMYKMYSSKKYHSVAKLIEEVDL